MGENKICAVKNSKLFVIFALIFLLLITVLLSLMLGSVYISPGEVFKSLFGSQKPSVANTLIKTVRIPRILAGVVAGAGLAASGVILQGVMNNALASPNTIGVNSGAGFAVMLSMLIWSGSTATNTVMAFSGALVTTLIIFAVAYFADRSRATIILAGITVSSFLSAGINTIKLMNTDITVNITSFMIGSISGVTLNKLILPAVLVLVAVIIAIILSRPLNILCLGDDIARSLGLRVNLLRFILLILASVLAGVVVSYAGLISFVGLIVPHICRRLFGNDNRFLLPCSVLLGGSFVLLCDMAGRLIFAPYELPAGIITSLFGGPFFLYLLLSKKGGRRVNA